jgi:hypothetical protein
VLCVRLQSKKTCALLRSYRDSDYNQPNYVSGRMGHIDQMGASFALDPVLPGFAEPKIGWQGGALIERSYFQGGAVYQQNQNMIANNNMAQQCSDACVTTDLCVSFNINLETGECQLSTAVAGKPPGKKLSPFKDFRYYERTDAAEIMVCNAMARAILSDQGLVH